MLTTYVSDRDILLVYHGLPRGKTLTVENYLKWYSIYVVNEEGKVCKLPYMYVQRYETENPGHCAWSDHIPTLEFCRWLTSFDFEWDSNAIEMIVGRWLCEGRGPIDKELLKY